MGMAATLGVNQIAVPIGASEQRPDQVGGVVSRDLEEIAGNGTRTHDILLGKQTLYQLSYTRRCEAL